jgi:hypothetical protein
MSSEMDAPLRDHPVGHPKARPDVSGYPGNPAYLAEVRAARSDIRTIRRLDPPAGTDDDAERRPVTQLLVLPPVGACFEPDEDEDADRPNGSAAWDRRFLRLRDTPDRRG